MRIDLLFPVLPPTLDGIGDHTARIAVEMAPSCDVRILTAQTSWTPIAGVDVETAFSLDWPWQISRLVDAVREDPPDWLVVQFNQFSYGRWGFNPFLPLALRRLRTTMPRLQIAWMAHEDFVPATNWKFLIMRQWQRWQFQALGDTADIVFFSIDPWVATYGSWFHDTPVFHFPIGSNMPQTNADRHAIRAGLGLDPDQFVVGFFGTLRARLVGHIAAAMDALNDAAAAADRPAPALLYVGPDGTALQAALPMHHVIDAGRLPADDVSRHLHAMDLHLTPFVDGVSTRRGSFMAGLQHGLPTVATHGKLTDHMLRHQDGRALCLTAVDDPDAYAQAAVQLYETPDRRREMSNDSRRLYDEHFDFAVTVPAFLDTLFSHSPSMRHEPNRVHAHR